MLLRGGSGGGSQEGVSGHSGMPFSGDTPLSQAGCWPDSVPLLLVLLERLHDMGACFPETEQSQRSLNPRGPGRSSPP